MLLFVFGAGLRAGKLGLADPAEMYPLDLEVVLDFSLFASILGSFCNDSMLIYFKYSRFVLWKFLDDIGDK